MFRAWDVYGALMFRGFGKGSSLPLRPRNVTTYGCRSPECLQWFTDARCDFGSALEIDEHPSHAADGTHAARDCEGGARPHRGSGRHN